MAENVTLARPYAEAAFKLATRESAGAPPLSDWASALSLFATIISNPAISELLTDPRIDASQTAQVCLDLAKNDAKGEVSHEQANFLRLLAENDRLVILPEIVELFNQLKNGHEGVKNALITTAFPLDEVSLQSVVTDLEKKFGCKITTTVEINRELIGGVRIAVGDEVIDASVRGKLAAMATALKN